MSLTPQARILITGAHGMVGRSLVAALRTLGHRENLLCPRRTELDLEDRRATVQYFEHHRPEFLIHLAARVGGIAANVADPVGFLDANVRMGCHVLEAAHRARVRKTLLLGSSCMYPRACPQPMHESSLMTGPLEPTNEGYALAKIMTLKLGQSYQAQHGLRVVCPVPSNIYGPGDHFDLTRSHVLSALVKRFTDAVREGRDTLTLWGTGAARREFIHVHDVSDAILFFMDHVTTSEILNVGPGEDVSIRELAELIAEKTGFRGRIAWDPSKPDGMPRKCMDVGAVNALGFRTKVTLAEGIDDVRREYEEIQQ